MIIPITRTLIPSPAVTKVCLVLAEGQYKNNRHLHDKAISTHVHTDIIIALPIWNHYSSADYQSTCIWYNLVDLLDTIEQHPMAVNESSSVYLPAASSPSFTYTASTSSMHTYTTISSAADSFSIPASFPRPFPSTSNLHSSIESFSSPSLSISQPPLMDPVITTTTKTS